MTSLKHISKCQIPSTRSDMTSTH